MWEKKKDPVRKAVLRETAFFGVKDIEKDVSKETAFFGVNTRFIGYNKRNLMK